MILKSQQCRCDSKCIGLSKQIFLFMCIISFYACRHSNEDSEIISLADVQQPHNKEYNYRSVCVSMYNNIDDDLEINIYIDSKNKPCLFSKMDISYISPDSIRVKLKENHIYSDKITKKNKLVIFYKGVLLRAGEFVNPETLGIEQKAEFEKRTFYDSDDLILTPPSLTDKIISQQIYETPFFEHKVLSECNGKIKFYINKDGEDSITIKFNSPYIFKDIKTTSIKIILKGVKIHWEKTENGVIFKPFNPFNPYSTWRFFWH